MSIMSSSISSMPESIAIPVVGGLVVGIAFVATIVILISPSSVFPPNIKLKEELGDLEGQQKAVDILLSDPKVRMFVAGKNFEVWAYGANFPQESINEGICAKDKCTLIGIQERNPDGTADCPVKTLINIETRLVDEIFYGGPCNIDRR